MQIQAGERLQRQRADTLGQWGSLDRRHGISMD